MPHAVVGSSLYGGEDNQFALSRTLSILTGLRKFVGRAAGSMELQRASALLGADHDGGEFGYANRPVNSDSSCESEISIA
jgi:hypothetical protein